ncbi:MULTISPECIES: DUF2513 domain-containing protein [unclassified Oceanobacter]|uniref:DUF2513 domain-containing protein n=1 Tax=unclassified Oceanobacter TaxID=2620260 RepID=UPI0027342922|nr:MULTISPECIES: DUF2513 domain-containing protein [unclassified Oceanobacter]MDP2607735.1 DUF2513 domain-containing protein [Oceanobacter sp. 1_MG-2023]MDP2611081.1 DUF2513 domain-containing protein [Oceanobacter sp. 2_MG-2023]
MKIDQEYLKGLLEAFEASNTPTTDIKKLEHAGFSYQEDKFIFHLSILADQNFVEREQGHGLGYLKGADGNISWSEVPLRLTAAGHEFLEALRNSEVWDTIKSEFKDASIGTLCRVSKDLFEGYTKKKVTSLLGRDE